MRLHQQAQCNSASWRLPSGTCLTHSGLSHQLSPLSGLAHLTVQPQPSQTAVAEILLYQNSRLPIALLRLKTFQSVLFLLCKQTSASWRLETPAAQSQ